MEMISCPGCGDSIGMDEVICPFCSASVYGGGTESEDCYEDDIDDDEEEVEGEKDDPREFPFVEGDTIKLRLEEDPDPPYGLTKMRTSVLTVTQTKRCEDPNCDSVDSHQLVRVAGKRFWYDHCHFKKAGCGTPDIGGRKFEQTVFGDE